VSTPAAPTPDSASNRQTSDPLGATSLCDTCRHQQVVRNTRGSSFSLCRRSRTEPAYPRYPRLPVLRCPGYEPRSDEG
jgi:hypothetical protein